MTDDIRSRFAPDPLAASVNERISQIMSDAESAATSLQREVEEATARRAAEVRSQAEADAERIRRAAEARAGQYLDEQRRRVDAWAENRIRRMQELSDGLAARTEAILPHLAEAERTRQALEALTAAIGVAAQRAAAEADRPAIRLPGVDGSAPARGASTESAPSVVAKVASELPRSPRPRPVDPQDAA